MSPTDPAAARRISRLDSFAALPYDANQLPCVNHSRKPSLDQKRPRKQAKIHWCPWLALDRVIPSF